MCCSQKYLPQLLGTQTFMQVEHKKLPHPALWDSIVYTLQPHHSVRSVSYSKIIPLWSPALGDNQLQTSSNHPTSYGHLPLWSPLCVVNSPGHLYSKFMLTTRRKKPFLPLFTPPPKAGPPQLPGT